MRQIEVEVVLEGSQLHILSQHEVVISTVTFADCSFTRWRVQVQIDPLGIYSVESYRHRVAVRAIEET